MRIEYWLDIKKKGKKEKKRKETKKNYSNAINRYESKCRFHIFRCVFDEYLILADIKKKEKKRKETKMN